MASQLLFWSLKNNLRWPVEGYRIPAEASREGTQGGVRVPARGGRTVSGGLPLFVDVFVGTDTRRWRAARALWMRRTYTSWWDTCESGAR